MANHTTVQIVYFSGTGGTARFAAHIRDALAARGTAVTLTELGPTPAPPVQAQRLVLVYPVYAGYAPQPIGQWIAAALDGHGTPAAVLSVSGGGEVPPNTACRVATIRQLQRKGYMVFYERMLVMPSNFIMPYSDALAAHLLRAAPIVAAQVAADVLAGTVRRTRPNPIDRVLRRLFLLEHIGSRYFGRGLLADKACNGCGLCARRCPRGNIAMQGGKPAFGNGCVLCMRCLYACPQKAIRARMGGFAVLRGGFDLSAVEARTQGIAHLPPVDGLSKGIALAGVRAYLRQVEADQ